MSAANFVESFAKLAGIWPDKFISVSEYLEEQKAPTANEVQAKARRCLLAEGTGKRLGDFTPPRLQPTLLVIGVVQVNPNDVIGVAEHETNT